MSEDRIPYMVENAERDTFTIYVKGTKPYLDLEKRLKNIKDYLKQVHIEQQKGILSSNNLIWENIIRLCDGLEMLGGEK